MDRKFLLCSVCLFNLALVAMEQDVCGDTIEPLVRFSSDLNQMREQAIDSIQALISSQIFPEACRVLKTFQGRNSCTPLEMQEIKCVRRRASTAAQRAQLFSMNVYHKLHDLADELDTLMERMSVEEQQAGHPRRERSVSLGSRSLVDERRSEVDQISPIFVDFSGDDMEFYHAQFNTLYDRLKMLTVKRDFTLEDRQSLAAIYYQAAACAAHTIDHPGFYSEFNSLMERAQNLLETVGELDR